MGKNSTSSVISVLQIFPNKRDSANWFVTLRHRDQEYKPVQMTTSQICSWRPFKKRIIAALGIFPDFPETQADWEKYWNSAVYPIVETLPIPTTSQEQRAIFQKLYPYSPLPRKRNKPPWD